MVGSLFKQADTDRTKPHMATKDMSVGTAGTPPEMMATDSSEIIACPTGVMPSRSCWYRKAIATSVKIAQMPLPCERQVTQMQAIRYQPPAFDIEPQPAVVHHVPVLCWRWRRACAGRAAAASPWRACRGPQTSRRCWTTDDGCRSGCMDPVCS